MSFYFDLKKPRLNSSIIDEVSLYHYGFEKSNLPDLTDETMLSP
jgi:hypothetical protein